MSIKALRKVSGMGRLMVRSGYHSCSLFFITEVGWKPPERGRWKSSYQIPSGNAGSTPAPSILVGDKKYESKKI